MVPVILIDDIQNVGDSADVATRWSMQRGTNAGGGGTLATVALQNDAASGTRLITESVVVVVSGAVNVAAELQVGNTSLAVSLRGRFRDGGTGTPVGVVGMDTEAGISTASVDLDLLADSPLILPWKIVLNPGNEWIWQAGTTANTLQVSFLWREIKLPVLV